jgi:hypothetical protein
MQTDSPRRSAMGSAADAGVVTDFWDVSKILTVGSEPVISFSKKGKSFIEGLPF